MRVPEQLGLSAAQIDTDIARGISHDMAKPIVDPCPGCYGRMLVGDYVCWGFCGQCANDPAAHPGSPAA